VAGFCLKESHAKLIRWQLNNGHTFQKRTCSPAQHGQASAGNWYSTAHDRYLCLHPHNSHCHKQDEILLELQRQLQLQMTR
jgi:hypothetical protein